MKGKGQNIHELTRIEAYLLSEKAGHPSHMHDYFWSQAETIVRQRISIVDVALKAAGKKSAPAAKSTAAKPAAKPTPTGKKPAAPVAKKPAASAASPAAEIPATPPAAVAKAKPASSATKKAAPKTGKATPKSK